MPLPTDEHLISLSRDLIGGLEKINGVHPGFRPAHAKGVLVSGSFTPSIEAAGLTRAPHARPGTSTPVLVRFSDSTGIPSVADNDPKAASPRGIAIRFQLGEHVHTDVIGHSANAFPARTGEEFLEFLTAAAEGRIEQFLGTHPAALHFVTLAKPIPTSFAREAFFTLTAFKFTNAQGLSRFGRFRVVPALGTEYLTNEAAAAKGPNFLFDELSSRFAKGPVAFDLVVQVAEDGDTVDDATVQWPDERRLLKFGTIELTSLVPDNIAEQKRIIFDPIPRVDGIHPSGDPLLDVRASVYLMSGRRRRQA
jgi:catalase